MTWRPATHGQDVYWEDLVLGDVVTGPGVTLTDAHLLQWTGLTGDWLKIHLDDEYAARGHFGRRVGHGPLTMALAIGLVTQAQVFGNAVAWLGADDVRARAPVFPGDTIQSEATVAHTRPTSRPDRGIWGLDYAVYNQDDVPVMTFRSTLMIYRRPHPEAESPRAHTHQIDSEKESSRAYRR